MENSVTLPEDLLAVVAKLARAEGKTPEGVVEEATRRYVTRERLNRFVRRNEQRARELWITESGYQALSRKSAVNSGGADRWLRSK